MSISFLLGLISVYFLYPFCIFTLGGSGYALRQSSLANSADSSISWSDLSGFRTIEEDVLALVNKNDFAAAKTRVKDLETAWDQSAAVLKASDKARWTESDASIDAVLHEIRSSKPNPDTSKNSLEISMNLLQ